MGRKESNQTNKTKSHLGIHCGYGVRLAKNFIDSILKLQRDQMCMFFCLFVLFFVVVVFFFLGGGGGSCICRIFFKMNNFRKFLNEYL